MFVNRDRELLFETEGNESRIISCSFNQQGCTSDDFEKKKISMILFRKRLKANILM